MNMVTTGPAGLDTSMLPNEWEPYRCLEGNKRTLDINHRRSLVRYFCDRCRKTHTVPIGQANILATP